MTRRHQYARRATCALLAVAALLTGAAKCGTESTPPPQQVPAARHKGNTVQVFVEGTGRNVWILFVADARQVDVHTSYHLPYMNEAKVSFGAKIEAKNGPNDRGSITCSMALVNGTPVGDTHTAYGAGASVTCIYDATRA